MFRKKPGHEEDQLQEAIKVFVEDTGGRHHHGRRTEKRCRSHFRHQGHERKTFLT